MKKSTLLLMFVFVFAAAAVNAQSQGDIRAGVGLVYGTQASVEADPILGVSEKGGLGVNIGAEYFFSDVISGAPSYTFFFKEEIGGVDFSTSSFNIDGRYYFGSDAMFYGLLGLSFASAKSQVLGINVTANETGLNLGGGVVIPAGDNFGINGQIKYNTPLEQLAIQAGILVSF